MHVKPLHVVTTDRILQLWSHHGWKYFIYHSSCSISCKEWCFLYSLQANVHKNTAKQTNKQRKRVPSLHYGTTCSICGHFPALHLLVLAYSLCMLSEAHWPFKVNTNVTMLTKSNSFLNQKSIRRPFNWSNSHISFFFPSPSGCFKRGKTSKMTQLA